MIQIKFSKQVPPDLQNLLLGAGFLLMETTPLLEEIWQTDSLKNFRLGHLELAVKHNITITIIPS